MSHAIRTIATPLGPYLLAASAGGLTHVQPAGAGGLPAHDARAARDATVRRHLDAAQRALDAYFGGEPAALAGLVLAPSGSAFQERVWQALREIPFGRTASYGEIARRIGREGGARAVGGANHDNPLGIVVPCHRVIGADGRLVGYAGGLERKRWLLAHEGVLPA